MNFTFHLLKKFRFYTLMNVLGLSLSLASTLLLVRYLYAELTVDHYNPDWRRMSLFTVQYEGNPTVMIGSNENLNHDPNFKDPMNDPEVEAYSCFRSASDVEIQLNEHRFVVDIFIADSMFMPLTRYPLIAGDGSLKTPESAVISEDLARKLFGKADPLGKTFIGHTGAIQTVTGVFGKPSTKSSLVFDLLISKNLSSSWAQGAYCIARLRSPGSFELLNKKNDYFFELKGYLQPIRMQFYPLKDFYTDRNLLSYSEGFQRGSSQNHGVLIMAVFLLLAIGVFNFINIYSVLMLKRAREFGLKRLFGIRKKEVFFQLWKENLVIAFLALLVALSLMEIMELLISRFLFIQFVPDIRLNLLLSIGVLSLLPLITAIFPWLRFCRTPAWVSIRSISTGGQSLVSRKVFLLIQYGVTCFLVVISIFFCSQIHFFLHYDYGYKTKDIIQCDFLSSYTTFNREDRMAVQKKNQNIIRVVTEKLNASPLFLSWSAGSNPARFEAPSFQFKRPGGEFEMITLAYFSEIAIRMFDFRLKEGRIWDPEQDNSRSYKLILNETAKKLFKIKDIRETLLHPASRAWIGPEEDGTILFDVIDYEIIGVIEDFRSGHLSQPVAPMAILYQGSERKGFSGSIMLQVAPGKRQEAIAFLSDLYKELNGSAQFEYTFLEDDIADLYKEDRKVATVYSSFALMAILISAIGLFGLSLFDIRQRYREIALRKVNGATFQDIRKLLFVKYLKLLLGSFVIAAPMAYLFLQRYVENYATHAPISWWIFVAAALFTLAVSGLTLIWQVQKASMLNPAEALRTE